MFNVCPICGEYGVERKISGGAGTSAALCRCDACGADIPFIRKPVWLVSGASGAGKSAVTLELARRTSPFTVLEMDVLWGAIPVNNVDDDLDRYLNTWLRLAKNLNQAPVQPMLLGSVQPDRLERLPERRYLAEIHALALIAESHLIEERLMARPLWRESGGEPFIQAQIAYNQWFIDQAGSQGWTLVDTSSGSVADTADQVLSWAASVTPGRPS